jgi:hypothetical protein
LARSPPAVCHRQVVEDEQLSWLQSHGDLDVVHGNAVARKERELRIEAVKLHPAEKARLDLHAREEGRAFGCGSLDDASEASLDIAPVIVPGAVGPAIGSQPLDELLRRWPRALTQER